MVYSEATQKFLDSLSIEEKIALFDEIKNDIIEYFELKKEELTNE